MVLFQDFTVPWKLGGRGKVVRCSNFTPGNSAALDFAFLGMYWDFVSRTSSFMRVCLLYFIFVGFALEFSSKT